MHNALAGAAAGLAAGLSLDDVVPGLAAPSRAAHRSTVIRAGGVVIVDDSYNAAPRSVIAALDVLAGVPAARRIAVLGEMRELGDAHDAGHLEVGRAAGEALDALVVVDGEAGGAARGIVDGALAAGLAPAGSITAVATAEDAVRGHDDDRPARRRGAGQGVAWRGARARRRRRSSRRSAARSRPRDRWS